MENQIAGVLIPILALLISALIVAGLWTWWSGSRSSSPPPVFPRVEQGLPHITSDAVRAESPLSRLAEPSTPTTGEAQLVELMRVLRDVADGTLVVETDGQRYHSLAEMGDEQIRRRFTGNVVSLARFARLDQAEAAAQSAAKARMVPPPLAEPKATDAAARQRGLFGLGKKPVPQQQAASPATIVDEIEQLLQKRLAMVPDLALREIHLHTAPDGGVLVEADGRFYEGVDAVPDAACREFIHKTIQEWESRQ
jgi:hypothetical protein